MIARPAEWKVDAPEGEDGGWRIERFEVSERECLRSARWSW